MLSIKLFLGFSVVLLSGISNEKPLSNENYKDLIIESKATTKAQNTGKEIYTDFCIQCHGANGKGDAKNFPPLAGSDWLTTKRTQSIAAVKFGQSGAIIVNKIEYNGSMPAMGLSNDEIADVMNYVMTSWGNKQSKIVTAKEVETITKK